MTLRVLIAGGGLGGLTLAHGLRSAGLQPLVFEQGPAQQELTSSYRIHINPTGSRALHACLPSRLWDEFVERSAAPPRGIEFATERLAHLAFIPEPQPEPDPVAQSHPISRAGLRRLLLRGLDDEVAFDKRLVRYEKATDGQVTAHFADGSTATGDVLVGADGSSSPTRKQLLPSARVVDTGVGGMAGKVYLTQSVRDHLGPRLLSQMTMVLPSRGMGMFIAPFQRRIERVLPMDAVDLPEHVFWSLIGRAETFGLAQGARPHSAADLHLLARRTAERWHPLLRELIAAADPASLISVPLHTSQPVPAWQTTTVTLLGDAVHTMTPLQGLGGNTAVRDAAVLCDQLVKADRAQAPLLQAIASYEAAMRGYGREAVERSLQVSNAVATTSAVQRLAFKSVLRAADNLPWLHQRMFSQPIEDLPFLAPARSTQPAVPAR